MKKYTLSKTESLAVDCPDVLPMPGETYVVARAFYTPRKKYTIGTLLKLVERTRDAPHGALSSLGNWIVEDEHVGLSVWTTIEMAIADGLLVKIEG